MKELNLSALDIVDSIKFAMCAIPGIQKKHPELCIPGVTDQFNYTAEVAGCRFFVREFEIDGEELVNVLPRAHKWLRENQLGYCVTREVVIATALWHGYEFDGNRFIRTSKVFLPLPRQ